MTKIIDCPFCHHKGIAQVYAPGSPMLEGLLWLLIIPGLIYSLWRRSKRKIICPSCSTEYSISLLK